MNIISSLNAIRSLYAGGDGDFSQALKDLVENAEGRWALAGGLALGFHGFIRATEDIDIIIEGDHVLESFKWSLRLAFKRISKREHMVKHIKTGLEIEILTPEWLKEVPKQVFNFALENIETRNVNGVSVPVVNIKALYALKLQRASRPESLDEKQNLKTERDRLDIRQLMLDKKNMVPVEQLEKSGWSPAQKQMYENLFNRIGSLKHFTK